MKQSSADSIEEEPEEYDACFDADMESEIVSDEQSESDTVKPRELQPISTELVEEEEPSEQAQEVEGEPLQSELVEEEEPFKEAQEAKGEQLQPVSPEVPAEEVEKAKSEQARTVSRLSCCAITW